MPHRVERIGAQIQRDISDLLRSQVRDPRLATMISVTRVEVSSDFKNATVHVSVLGDDAQKRDMMKGLNAASGFLRRELTRRLNLRRSPELMFKMDESMEQAARVLKLLDDIGQQDSGKS